MEKTAIDRVKRWFESSNIRKMIFKELKARLKDKTQTEKQIQKLKEEIRMLTEKKKKFVTSLCEADIKFFKEEICDIKMEIENKQNELKQFECINLPDYDAVVVQCMRSYDNMVKGVNISCRNNLRDLLRDLGVIVKT